MAQQRKTLVEKLVDASLFVPRWAAGHLATKGAKYHTLTVAATALIFYGGIGGISYGIYRLATFGGEEPQTTQSQSSPTATPVPTPTPAAIIALATPTQVSEPVPAEPSPTPGSTSDFSLRDYIVAVVKTTEASAPAPSPTPVPVPTAAPTATPPAQYATATPTPQPAVAPTSTPRPTAIPTPKPTLSPTPRPTLVPGLEGILSASTFGFSYDVVKEMRSYNPTGFYNAFGVVQAAQQQVPNWFDGNPANGEVVPPDGKTAVQVDLSAKGGPKARFYLANGSAATFDVKTDVLKQFVADYVQAHPSAVGGIKVVR